MDYAINDYSKYVLSDGTFRVAKLNNQTKRPVLTANFMKALEKLRQAPVDTASLVEKAKEEVASVGSQEHSYDVVLGRMGMTTESYDSRTTTSGYRKLKVNSLVENKLSDVRDFVGLKVKTSKQEDKVVKQEIVEVPLEAVQKEVEQPNVMNDLKIQPENVASMNDFMGINETRTSRYEQPAPSSNILNTPDRFKENNVIDATSRFKKNTGDENNSVVSENTGKVLSFPSRVERNNAVEEKNPYTESVNALVNEGSGAYQGKLNVGEDRRKLDIINNRINNESIVSTSNNSNEALQEAYDNFSSSEQRKKASIDEYLSLQKKVKLAQEKLKQQQAERAEKIADLNSRIKDNEAEIADYTMHSEDLRKQLDELLSQLDEASSYDSGYGRGRRAA